MLPIKHYREVFLNLMNLMHEIPDTVGALGPSDEESQPGILV
jgi:hypothetical protein